MWRVDTTQHIHVDAEVTEKDVLQKATAVAQQSSGGAPLVLDLWPVANWPCECQIPDGWKTYQVLLYTPETQTQTGSDTAPL